MSALTEILAIFRQNAQTEREKGNYFENLVKIYLLNEPLYKDLFNGQVFLWEEWRRHWMLVTRGIKFLIEIREKESV